MPNTKAYPTRRQGKSQAKSKANGANLGFEEKLWQAADKMRGHMDPAEYKHVVLGLIFLGLLPLLLLVKPGKAGAAATAH